MSEPLSNTRSSPGSLRARTLLLVHPSLIALRDDPFTTGVVYMPVGLAYVAASLRDGGVPVRVVDAFGEAPNAVRADGKFLWFGLSPELVAAHADDPALAAVFVYANSLTNHVGILALLRAISGCRPGLPLVVLENTQAVTAYALQPISGEFFDAGASHVFIGGREELIVRLARALVDQSEDPLTIAGVGTRDRSPVPDRTISDLDALPAPAWDLFPLHNYWRLGYGHGPVSARRYLPLQTSRGCPYPCTFCVVPTTNNRKWKGRSPKAVVDEIQQLMDRYGVREFHVEDLNPTVSDERIRGICQEIISRNLDIRWKIVAGTKVETIRDEGTIDLMARAGCRYISISPETGSPRVLKLIQKPFDIEHALRLLHRMSSVGIYSQACFVLGFPGETREDRELTRELVRRLTKAGVDEVALFIVTPVPGSAIFDRFSGYSTLSELNFTPTWRSDFSELARFRLHLYADFLRWKLRYHPGKILRQPFKVLARRFDTKMEMVSYRAAMYRLRALWAGH